MPASPTGGGSLTVRENPWAAAQLHGVPGSTAKACAQRTLADLELGRGVDRRASALSQGKWQRVGLGSALVHEPRLVVLDGRTNALDPAGVLPLRELAAVARRRGRRLETTCLQPDRSPWPSLVGRG